MNLLVKYADDANPLEPPDSDGLNVNKEFNNVIKWATENRMKNVNLQKTKKIVLRRDPNPKFIAQSFPIEYTEQLLNAIVTISL